MVRVKICGITTPQDALRVCKLGADLVGVVVEPRVLTPRGLFLKQAKLVLEATEGAKRVAVITSQEPHLVKTVVKELAPDLLQVHLDLPPIELVRLRELARVPIIGLVSMPREGEIGLLLSRAKEVAEAVDYLLLDSLGGGGVGVPHNWGLSRKIRQAVKKPVILAGGLNPANVRRAIEVVDPHVVDVSSGVESSPGKKDPELIKRFITAVKGNV